jgi:hypothetical protein
MSIADVKAETNWISRSKNGGLEALENQPGAELKEGCHPIWNLNFVILSRRSKITVMMAD